MYVKKKKPEQIFYSYRFILGCAPTAHDDSGFRNFSCLIYIVVGEKKKNKVRIKRWDSAGRFDSLLPLRCLKYGWLLQCLPDVDSISALHICWSDWKCTWCICSLTSTSRMFFFSFSKNVQLYLWYFFSFKINLTYNLSLSVKQIILCSII